MAYIAIRLPLAQQMREVRGSPAFLIFSGQLQIKRAVFISQTDAGIHGNCTPGQGCLRGNPAGGRKLRAMTRPFGMMDATESDVNDDVKTRQAAMVTMVGKNENIANCINQIKVLLTVMFNAMVLLTHVIKIVYALVNIGNIFL